MRILVTGHRGSRHVLLAAGVRRVIHFFSAQVFGTAEGERLPDYLPLDDAHPRRAMRPYGLSKRLAVQVKARLLNARAIPGVAIRQDAK